MGFEIIQSDTVFRGKVFNVRVDQIRLPDGRIGRIDLIEHRGAVTIIPVDQVGQIWFIRQHRHPASEDLLELPAGVMDEREEPAQSAQRELREEIGMAAKNLVPLGEFFLAPGYSTEYMYVYLAQELEPAPLPQDEDEQIEIVKISIKDLPDLVNRRQIRDAKSLASLFLWQNRGNDYSPA